MTNKPVDERRMFGCEIVQQWKKELEQQPHVPDVVESRALVLYAFVSKTFDLLDEFEEAIRKLDRKDS